MNVGIQRLQKDALLVHWYLSRCAGTRALLERRSDWKSFRFSNRYMAMMKEMANWADASEERSLVFTTAGQGVGFTASAYEHIGACFQETL